MRPLVIFKSALRLRQSRGCGARPGRSPGPPSSPTIQRVCHPVADMDATKARDESRSPIPPYCREFPPARHDSICVHWCSSVVTLFVVRFRLRLLAFLAALAVHLRPLGGLTRTAAGVGVLLVALQEVRQVGYEVLCRGIWEGTWTGTWTGTQD